MPSTSSKSQQVSGVRDENVVKRNKPKATRLRQQKLPAWQPILTSTTVIPTIFIISIVFIPVGVLLLMASNSVKEWSTYYDHCNDTICNLSFSLSEDFPNDVYFYYGLENFFQNHRRYMKSRSDRQLLGDLNNVGGCEPYHEANTSMGVKPVAPCGAIANSMFNDNFTLFYGLSIVPWTHEGLVWDVDRTTKFRNPSVPTGKSLCDVFNILPSVDKQFLETKKIEEVEGSVKPAKWVLGPCELDPNHPDNNGFQNSDFIIWMRTAALPNFRKPYRVLKRNDIFANGLPAGNYTLQIVNNYSVKSFSGRKSFIISTTSWAGGKNSFLGIAYIVVGVICLVLSVVFFGIHKKFGHL